MSSQIAVEFYSGSRSDEVPRGLVVAGQKLAVRRIIRQEAIGSRLPGGGYYRRFVVEVEDSSHWELREAPETCGGWMIEKLNPELMI